MGEKQAILKKLIHKPGLTFNQLWSKEGPSNNFAYHLKALEKQGLIKKEEDGYVLTHEGKKEATYIEGDTGKKAKPPLIGVIAVITKGDKVLMCKRTKEPFYGYWGFVGGKLKFNQYILECAQTEIKEESGLECDLELKGLYSSKTFNNDKLSYNHQLFIVKATNPKGTLIEETREGVNQWFTIEEIKQLKTFPNAFTTIDIAFNKGFKWVEADRIQENDAFTGQNVVSETEF